MDGALPGVALQSGERPAVDTLPWMDPVNLHRMADILAADLGRLLPAQRDTIATRLSTLRQRLLGITSTAETRLARARSVSVWSLSDRLDYFVTGFNLDPAGRTAMEDTAWTASAAATLVQQLKAQDVDVVLHHQPLPAPLETALTQAGRRIVVVDITGRDPLNELEANAQKLVAAFRVG